MKWIFPDPTVEELRQMRVPDMDEPCDECGFPFWLCNAIAAEAVTRGGVDEHRAEVEAEYRNGTFKPIRAEWVFPE